MVSPPLCRSRPPRFISSDYFYLRTFSGLQAEERLQGKERIPPRNPQAGLYLRCAGSCRTSEPVCSSRSVSLSRFVSVFRFPFLPESRSLFLFPFQTEFLFRSLSQFPFLPEFSALVSVSVLCLVSVSVSASRISNSF